MSRIGYQCDVIESEVDRGIEWAIATEAPREPTGKGQCMAKRGAHVHDEHVILRVEPLWSLENISC